MTYPGKCETCDAPERPGMYDQPLCGGPIVYWEKRSGDCGWNCCAHLGRNRRHVIKPYRDALRAWERIQTPQEAER